MGSKNSILPDVCKLFPKADNFYDLFGGGFSVTHFMIENRGDDFKQFHFNELKPGMTELIKDAISGKYNYDNFKPKFITRDDFFNASSDDQYIKCCWSFGNNGKDYLFGKDIEQYKKSLHNAIIFNDFDETAKKVIGLSKFNEGYSIKQKRLFARSRVAFLHKGKKRGEIERLQRLQQLQQLEQLERLEQLQQLQQLERRIIFYNKSYNQVDIKPNSVIYCDPPYRGTAKYNNEIDYQKFYDWAWSQENPVYISEYTLPDDRFKTIASFKKRSKLSSNKKKLLIKDEKVFGNKAAVKAFLELRKK